jgi:hypothetical protein
MDLRYEKKKSQEIVQSAGTTPNKAKITNSNPSSPSCVDMSKNKK